MRKLIVAFWTCFTAAAAAGGEVGVIPETLYAPDWERPVWVRADRALTADGTLDSELFDEGERRVIQGFLPISVATDSRSRSVRRYDFLASS